MGKGRTFFGVLLSAIYFIWVSMFVLPKLHTITDLSLNEAGDFFAGIFGPLAFLWLVLGYFQQGAELRQNNAALKLQAQELKNSVDQQKELVAVTREQVTMEMENIRQSQISMAAAAQPFFDLAGAGGSHTGTKHSLRFSITNLGAPVTDVQVNFQGSLPAKDRKLRSLDRGGAAELSLEFNGDWDGIKGQIVISYLTGLGTRGESTFHAWIELDGAHPRIKFSRG